MGRHAADQGFSQIARLEAFEITAKLIDETQAHLVGNNLVVEDPFPRLRNGYRRGKQVVHLNDVDAAISHLLHKVEMIALGVLHPQHVIEEQSVAIGGRKPLMSATGRADHDLAQLTNLGMDAERRGIRHC
jgi:hypothetical protein